MEETKAKPVIKCAENGPLIVAGLEHLTGADGGAFASKPQFALCRCGASQNKPFCDGTHTKIGFDGAKEADRTADEQQSYAGKDGTIHDNRGLCAHAGVCTDRLPKVWRMQGGPWIDPDGADAAAIADVVARCPSGALAYVLASGSPDEADAKTEPSIQVTKDGPYYVTGVELSGEEWGEGAERGRYTLCRCGASKNKPFCDGSHWDAGFSDEGTQTR